MDTNAFDVALSDPGRLLWDLADTSRIFPLLERIAVALESTLQLENRSLEEGRRNAEESRGQMNEFVGYMREIRERVMAEERHRQNCPQCRAHYGIRTLQDDEKGN